MQYKLLIFCLLLSFGAAAQLDKPKPNITDIQPVNLTEFNVGDNLEFSRFGSYYAFVRKGIDDEGVPGIYFKSVLREHLSNIPLFRLELSGTPIESEVFTPEKLTVRGKTGYAEIVFETENAIRIRSTGTGVRFINNTGVKAYHCNYSARLSDTTAFLSTDSGLLGFSTLKGSFVVVSPWNGTMEPILGSSYIEMEVKPDSRGIAEVLIQSCEQAAIPSYVPLSSFEGALKSASDNYTLWRNTFPRYPEKYAAMAEWSFYLGWSHFVKPWRLLKRPTQFCGRIGFNRAFPHDLAYLGLVDGQQQLAFDQMMVSLDYLSPEGSRPNSVNPEYVDVWFNIIPFEWVAMQRFFTEKNLFSREQMQEAYDKISLLTNWWLKYRKASNGLFYCRHGNETGADDNTLFLQTPLVVSPDLNACLVLQTDELARLATKLGLEVQAQQWSVKSKEILQLMIDKLWDSDRFSGTDIMDGSRLRSQSLINFIPLALGDKLPLELRKKMVASLKVEGHWLTPYGLASENLTSALYSKRYWRGNVWSFWNFLIVDGLWRGGEKQLAQEIARRYADNCVKNSIYEYYDALSGAGAGVANYTWSASIFLSMLREQLTDGSGSVEHK